MMLWDFSSEDEEEPPPPPPLHAALALSRLATPAGRAALVLALQEDGFARLTLEPGAAESIDACLEACRAHLASNNGRDASGKTPSLTVRASELGGAQIRQMECEAADVHASCAAWPQALGTSCVALYELLYASAHACLEAALLGLGMRTQGLAAVRALLPPPGRATRERDDDDAQSMGEPMRHESSLRLLSYARGACAGWHCDGALLTVAPRASAVGLCVRHLGSSVNVWPEAMMGHDELLVFAGDSLGYLTAGAIQPLMHRVDAPRKGAAERIAAPFFLRTHSDTKLWPPIFWGSPGEGAPTEAQGEWPQADGRKAVVSAVDMQALGRLPKLSAYQAECEMALRSTWSWKLSEYHADCVWLGSKEATGLMSD